MAHGISQEKLDEIGLEPEQVNGKVFLAPVYRNTYLGFLYKGTFEHASPNISDFTTGINFSDT